MDWIDVSEQLPPSYHRGTGTISETVDVILSNGKVTDDYLINGRWVWHCKHDNVGGYPVKWRYKDEKRI